MLWCGLENWRLAARFLLLGSLFAHEYRDGLRLDSGDDDDCVCSGYNIAVVLE